MNQRQERLHVEKMNPVAVPFVLEQITLARTRPIIQTNPTMIETRPTMPTNKASTKANTQLTGLRRRRTNRSMSRHLWRPETTLLRESTGQDQKGMEHTDAHIAIVKNITSRICRVPSSSKNKLHNHLKMSPCQKANPGPKERISGSVYEEPGVPTPKKDVRGCFDLAHQHQPPTTGTVASEAVLDSPPAIPKIRPIATVYRATTATPLTADILIPSRMMRLRTKAPMAILPR
ncbi:MAG: hypothetical protein M1816_004268 [Peltula sp. TS41687]|nr:MAG: hypothetical protein M1816_004268 [Peltula sp. TS41687]